MQSLGRKRMKNGGFQVTHYLNCPVLPYNDGITTNVIFYTV
jgi:hypothetical protein